MDGAHEEAGNTQTPFEKGNPTEKSETQNHRANDLLPRGSTLAGLPKVRKPIKLSKGVPQDPLFRYDGPGIPHSLVRFFLLSIPKNPKPD